MKKIILTLLIALILIPFADNFLTPDLSTNIAFAAGDETNKTLKDTKFNVDEFLKLESDDQEQKYFESGNPIVNFILTVIDFAIKIIGTIAAIIFIIGGFMMIVGQGNQQKIDDAKEVVKYGIIGLLVAFMSYIIVIFVQSLFITNDQLNNQTNSDDETATITSQIA